MRDGRRHAGKDAPALGSTPPFHGIFRHRAAFEPQAALHPDPAAVGGFHHRIVGMAAGDGAPDEHHACNGVDAAADSVVRGAAAKGEVLDEEFAATGMPQDAGTARGIDRKGLLPRSHQANADADQFARAQGDERAIEFAQVHEFAAAGVQQRLAQAAGPAVVAVLHHQRVACARGQWTCAEGRRDATGEEGAAQLAPGCLPFHGIPLPGDATSTGWNPTPDRSVRHACPGTGPAMKAGPGL